MRCYLAILAQGIKTFVSKPYPFCLKEIVRNFLNKKYEELKFSDMLNLASNMTNKGHCLKLKFT